MPALHYAWNTAGTQQINAFLPVRIHYHAPKAIRLFNRHLLIAYYVLGCREARKQGLSWFSLLVPGLEVATGEPPVHLLLSPPTVYTKGRRVLTTIQVPVLGRMGNTEIHESYVPKSLGPSA